MFAILLNMMQKMIEEQNGYLQPDAPPGAITGMILHPAAYSTDGDYFSNPNAGDVSGAVYNIMCDYNHGEVSEDFLR